MDTLITNLAGNDVPNTWLKICGQVGPTGNYNRKPLGAWFADLLLRVKQLKEWVDNTLAPPPSATTSQPGLQKVNLRKVK